MNGTLEIENTGQADVSENYLLEIPDERAKITGLICIGCAVTAVLIVFAGSLYLVTLGGMLRFSDSRGGVLYYVLVLLSAAFGLIGYVEIKAIGSSLISSLFQLLSAVLIIVSFLAVSGKPDNIQFAVIYRICAVFIPLMLTVLALFVRKAAVWKAFVPLAIPASYFLYLLAYPLRSSMGFLLATLSLPLSWALLGTIAYLGRK